MNKEICLNHALMILNLCVKSSLKNQDNFINQYIKYMNSLNKNIREYILLNKSITKKINILNIGFKNE